MTRREKEISLREDRKRGKRGRDRSGRDGGERETDRKRDRYREKGQAG